MRQSAAMILLATLSMMGCDDTDGARSSTSSSPDISPASIASADVQLRIAELKAFTPDSTLSGSQCGDLSVSNGSSNLTQPDLR